MKRYTEEKERLERQKEAIRGHLAQLRRDKRELKDMLLRCTGRGSGLGPGWNLGPRHMGFEREGPGFVCLTSGSPESPHSWKGCWCCLRQSLLRFPDQCPQRQQVVRLLPGWI